MCLCYYYYLSSLHLNLEIYQGFTLEKTTIIPNLEFQTMKTTVLMDHATLFSKERVSLAPRDLLQTTAKHVMHARADISVTRLE